MFKVTFQGPIIVGDAVALAELLGSAGVAAIVEPFHGDAPVTGGAVQEVAVPVKQETAPPARRGRKPKDKEEPATGQTGTAGETGQAEPEVTAAEEPAKDEPAADAGEGKGDSKGDAPPEVDTDLLERFTALVDKDYDAALALLEGFGVARFSDLTPEQSAAFADALAQQGV